MIYVPPTGSQSLDLVLEQLASNVGNLTADTSNIVTYSGNGSISAGGTIIGYRNRFMYVLYADDVYGSGQSTSPLNKAYYAIVNTNELTAPTNPLNYSYSQVSGGFGTTKKLFYKTIGGRQIQWFVGVAAPSSEWVQQPNTTSYVAIDLDTVTVAAGSNGWSVYQAAVFKSSNTLPITPTGGNYTFSTQTLVPPTGWYANIPTANDNVYVSSFLFASNVADVVTANTWDTPTAVYKFGANGTTTTVGVVYQANVLTPLAISSNGYYDFANASLLAPNGWSNTIPNNPSNSAIWSSQATFVTTNPAANISNTSTWSTPALTFQSGGVGPAGTRGFIPLAYVITSGDPTLYTNAQYTADFSASRVNTIPPIGTGYAPIAGDTAQFAGLGKSIVKSFDGTNWVTSVGQVVDGSLIVTGTLTAAQMNTNSVYALTMKGGSVTGPTDTANVGYWIDAGNGTALFTGSVIVGNLITTTSGITKLTANSVGSGNIIPGSITATQIAANTILANNIAAGTITADKLAANVLTVGNIVSFNGNLGNTSSNGYWLRYDTGDVRFGGNVSIGANLNVQGLINGSTLAANSVSRENLAPGTIPGSTGSGTVPSSITAGPGIANWGGLDSTSAVNIYWKTVAYFEFSFPNNVSTSVGYNVNFTADVVATGLAVSGTSGFPSITIGYNGVNRPNTTSYKAANPGSRTLTTKNFYGSTSINQKTSIAVQWATTSADWSPTGTDYVVVWLLATPSVLASNGTFTLTNVNFAVTPI